MENHFIYLLKIDLSDWPTTSTTSTTSLVDYYSRFNISNTRSSSLELNADKLWTTTIKRKFDNGNEFECKKKNLC